MNTVDLMGRHGHPAQIPECFLKSHTDGSISAIVNADTVLREGDVVYLKTDTYNKPIPQIVTEIHERRPSKGEWGGGNSSNGLGTIYNSLIRMA